ncbi:MAG: 50S ribosomal protein L4 [Candidatus Hydrogenedentota bacterium]|nr:MAG: 50S ribosomal protein L4 [Candidatus Hydrogenedentota bacterium]
MGIQLVTIEGQKKGELDLPSVLRLEKISRPLIWEVVKAEHANQRQGTHKTKEKGEVRGGGKKPWRQKGTGRARAGSIRSPIWVGGGTVFGPRPRSYREDIPRKKKIVAYRHILASKAEEGRLVALENIALEGISTKKGFDGILNAISASGLDKVLEEGRKIYKKSNRKRRKVLVIGKNESEEVKKSLRNIPWVELIDVSRLAALPLVYNHAVLITKPAYDELETRLSV